LPVLFKDLVSGLWFVVSGFFFQPGTSNYKPLTKALIIAFLVLGQNWTFFKGFS